MLRGVVLEFPQRGNDRVRASFNECVYDVVDSIFADGTDAGIACRQCDESGIQTKLLDLADPQHSVIRLIPFRREDERGAVGVLRVHIAV